MRDTLVGWLILSRYKSQSGLALLGLTMLLFMLAVFFSPGDIGTGYQMRDFYAFWVIGDTARTAGAAYVYDSSAISQAFNQIFPAEAGKRSIGFLYPPTTLLALAPLSFLPLDLAYILYCAVSLLLITLLSLLLAGPHGALLVWGFPSLFICLTYGQISLILVLTLALAVITLHRYPLFSGLMAGLCIIKPQLGFLVGVAALGGRHWRMILSATLTILLLCAITVMLFPEAWPAAFKYQVTNIAEPLSSPDWLKNFVSLYAFLRLHDVPLFLAFGLQTLAALLALVLTLYIFKLTARQEYHLLAIGLLPFWVTPFAYQYDTVIHLLALLALARLSKTEGLMLAEILALLALYIMPLWAMFSASTTLTLQIQLTASTTLIACLLYRVRSESVAAENKVHT